MNTKRPPFAEDVSSRPSERAKARGKTHKIRKDLKIILISVSFLFLSYLLLTYGINNIGLKRESINQGEWNLVDFEKEHNRYVRDRAKENKIVFVGPSYAIPFKTEASYNFGILACSKLETKYIIENYCDTTDRIIYPINVWEAIFKEKEVRRVLRNKLIRQLRIAKGIIPHELAGLMNMRKSSLEELQDQVLPFLTENERAFLYSLITDDEKRETRSRTVKSQLQMIPQIQKSEILELVEHYERLEKEYPNIALLYYSALPIDEAHREILTETELISDIMRLKTLETYLLVELKERKVEFLDVSDRLSASDYLDLVHLKKSGVSKSLEALWEDD
jgi:hypothetical protein